MSPLPRATRRAFVGGSLAALSAGAAARAADAPALIVHGGPIHTGDPARPTVEAVRFEGGRVRFAGPLAQARSGSGRLREIDLRGAAAVPGLVDSHTHLPHLGLVSMQLGLSKVRSLDELKSALAAYAAANREGPILGHGWIENQWPEKRFPTRDDLDPVASDRPVYLMRADGHLAVANSAMLALIQVGAGTPDPDGGKIERDGKGRPTGVLIDKAMRLADARLPAPTPEMKRRALKHAVALYAAAGWAGAANMSTSLADARLFDALAAAGELPVQMDVYVSDDDADGFFAHGPAADPTGLVNWRGLKLYMDGALGSRGAALLAPYSDAPSTSGLLVTPMGHMLQLMRRARAARAQVATHAIGDRGNRLTLDAYAKIFADDPAALRAARWRIEHAQVLAPSDIPRFGAMGVIASMQPSHAVTDLYFAPARLGPARLAGAYAWRSVLDAGGRIAGGTDAPVGTHDPQSELYAAISRHAFDGSIGEGWHAEQAVRRQEALVMFTTEGAYATFQERERGVLAPGMRADLSAFSADPMTAPPAEMLKAQAVLTVSNGRVTHDKLSARA